MLPSNDRAFLSYGIRHSHLESPMPYTLMKSHIRVRAKPPGKRRCGHALNPFSASASSIFGGSIVLFWALQDGLLCPGLCPLGSCRNPLLAMTTENVSKHLRPTPRLMGGNIASCREPLLWRTRVLIPAHGEKRKAAGWGAWGNFSSDGLDPVVVQLPSTHISLAWTRHHATLNCEGRWEGSPGGQPCACLKFGGSFY